MNAIIPAEFRPFVSDAVASGKYRSEEELLAVALGLLKERERKLDALRNDLRLGLDELDQGKAILLSGSSAQEDFFEAIKVRGRQRLGTPKSEAARPGD